MARSSLTRLPMASSSPGEARASSGPISRRPPGASDRRRRPRRVNTETETGPVGVEPAEVSALEHPLQAVRQLAGLTDSEHGGCG